MSNWFWSSTPRARQVLQTGLLLTDNAESVLKSVGSEMIFGTHQPDISRLKRVARSNIEDILVTLLTSQSLKSPLKDDAS